MNTHDLSPQTYKLISLFIILIAIAVRFFNLGGNSLWLDEAVYANNSYVATLEDLIKNTRLSNSSPIFLPYIYYLLGDLVRDPFWVRVLPSTFGIAAISCVLLLPIAGISHIVSAISAFWLAISPVQIKYSQEVREYSLSVLMTCALLWAFSYALEKKSKRSLIFFSATLFLTPFCSYGACFMVLAILFVYLIIRLFDRNLPVLEVLVLVLPMLLSLGITYFLTAKYQMSVGQAWYLVSYYPPDGVMTSLKWLVKTVIKYNSYALDGLVFGSSSIVILLIFFIALLMRKVNEQKETRLLLVFMVLVAGSTAAAFLNLYPFGGIRQHLFATPLIVVSSVVSAFWLSGKIRLNKMLFFMMAITSIAVLSIQKIPFAYVENEDVVSAVTLSLASVKDEKVYVYYGARPAINFHFPNRGFYMGISKRGDIDFMAKEIIRQMQSCDHYLLFSHVFKNEDKKIIEVLKQYGVMAVVEKKYIGASVVKVTRCEGRIGSNM